MATLSLGDSNYGLVRSLRDASIPTFTLGATPPLAGTDYEKQSEIATKFTNRARALATDGYIAYDIQPEDGRTADPRPFPFRAMEDPSIYGQKLSAVSGKSCIVYKCVVEHSHSDLNDWLDQATQHYGHGALNLVGAPTSRRDDYTGPTLPQAAAICVEKKIPFGCVTIAERHLKKGTEHLNLKRKTAFGAEWFISQAVYNAAATIKLINDYGEQCKRTSEAPKKILLTFAPCGRAKTMKFIKWLGIAVPKEVEQRIFGANEEEKALRTKDTNVAECVDLLCTTLNQILTDTQGSGVPLGLNVESVSIYREEIDAAHAMFRRMQVIMLDAAGRPWSVRWYLTVEPNEEEVKARALVKKFVTGTPEGREMVQQGATNFQTTVSVVLAFTVGFLIAQQRT